MAKPETIGQVGLAERVHGKPIPPEHDYVAGRLLTLSDIEKIIYQESGAEPKGIIGASKTKGKAIDEFLDPAEFIWRYRADYCFPEGRFPDWELEKVYSAYHPTGYKNEKERRLNLLRIQRSNFNRENIPPQHSNLEMAWIKQHLPDLWDEVAKFFGIHGLNKQSVMVLDGESLIPSEEVAIPEDVLEIGRRIVSERFEALVDDDKDYTYIARPDCLFVYELDGIKYHIQVQPDFIKRRRVGRKTTKKREEDAIKSGQIVAKRILGDYKDALTIQLAGYTGPMGETMGIYKKFLKKIGRQQKETQLRWVKTQDGLRRVYLIPQDAPNRFREDQVRTDLVFLHEEGGEMFTSMPEATLEDERRATENLENALRKSNQIMRRRR